MRRKKSKVKSPACAGRQKSKVRLSGISWEKVGLLVILLLLVGIQTRALFLPQSEFEKAKERIIKNPTDLEARLVLAEELLKNNRLGETEKELNTLTYHISHITYHSPISEITSKLDELRQEKQENNPQDLEILIQNWQEILKEKPDYRDGWLKLALYLIKAGRISEAQEALERAKQLDPNYEVIKELEKVSVIRINRSNRGNQSNRGDREN